jgi:hypothetical protein
LDLLMAYFTTVLKGTGDKKGRKKKGTVKKIM